MQVMRGQNLSHLFISFRKLSQDGDLPRNRGGPVGQRVHFGEPAAQRGVQRTSGRDRGVDAGQAQDALGNRRVADGRDMGAIGRRVPIRMWAKAC